MLEETQRHVRTQVPQENLHILVDQQGARTPPEPSARGTHRRVWPRTCWAMASGLQHVGGSLQAWVLS